MLTLSGFIIWLVFFDHNDIFLQMSRSSELRELRKSKDYYAQQIRIVKKDLSELQNNPASIEKAAREKYLMKKDNEDLYVFEEK
jgi:cell division protein DivIC